MYFPAIACNPKVLKLREAVKRNGRSHHIQRQALQVRQQVERADVANPDGRQV